MIYRAYDIEYDTDGKKIKLPKELSINVNDSFKTNEDKLEFISDEISNITGFCHFGFKVEPTLN